MLRPYFLAFTALLLLASLAKAEVCEKHLRKKLGGLTAIAEITAKEYSKENNEKFGRFYRVESQHNARLYWMLPFASDQACVVREVIRL